MTKPDFHAVVRRAREMTDTLVDAETQVATVTAQFPDLVADFLACTGMAESRFGRDFMKDPGFVSKVKSGRKGVKEPKPGATVAKMRQALDRMTDPTKVYVVREG